MKHILILLSVLVLSASAFEGGLFKCPNPPLVSSTPGPKTTLIVRSIHAQTIDAYFLGNDITCELHNYCALIDIDTWDYDLIKGVFTKLSDSNISVEISHCSPIQTKQKVSL